MADHLVETVMSAIPGGATSAIASLIGESPAATSASISAAVPALLAGAVQKSSTVSGANDLVNQLKQVTADGNPLDRVGTILADPAARGSFLTQGKGLAGSLLGGASDTVARTIGNAQHISGSAMSSILALAAPLVLGAMGRFAGANPTASSVQSLLSSERGDISRLLPAGLGSAFALGPVPAGAAAGSGGNTIFLGSEREREGASMWPWLLGALALALLAFFGLRNLTVPRAPTVTLNHVVHHVIHALPGGASIDVIEGSIGDQLAKFLASTDPVPKTFVFDNLNFPTAESTLTPESAPTVAAILAELKAYPNVRARVVGYTDNQGDAAANQRLSEARANTVKQELVNGGIAADRIEAAGMGEANPIGDNNTEEGRAKNRRTELVILSR
jgi:outer membrane protein OmpA-like peptidoglycan-associated protein